MYILASSVNYVQTLLNAVGFLAAHSSTYLTPGLPCVPQYEQHVQSEFGYTPFFWETKSPSQRTTGGECREYRTDDRGRIVYYIPPQAEDIDSVDIRVGIDIDKG